MAVSKGRLYSRRVNRALAVTSLVLIIVATIAFVLGFALPNWARVVHKPQNRATIETVSGIWRTCSRITDHDTQGGKDRFGQVRCSRPSTSDVLKATQAASSLALICALLALAMCAVWIRAEGCPLFPGLTLGLLIAAASFGLIALAVYSSTFGEGNYFGVMAVKSRPGYAYWLAMVGSCLFAIAAPIAGCGLCFPTRTKTVELELEP